MAQEQKDNKIVLKGDKVRTKLLEGALAAYETVTSTYGPKGRNVLIEKPFGRAVLTRDGVTVARDTYFSDRAKNVGAQAVLEASETTNRIAGDGTTATVALSYQLMKYGTQAINAGVHPMDVKSQLITDSQTILTKLEEMSKPVAKGQLQQVASISAGDPLLGQLIAEAIEYVGADGGILTEKAPVDSVEREYVDGYYLQSGFTALQMGKKEIIDPAVVVSSRRLSSAVDALEVLTSVARAKNMQPGQIPRILFIGNIEDAAYNVIVENINAGRLDAIIIKTPAAYGEMGKELLNDIATLAGCDVITDSTNLKDLVREIPDGLFSDFVGSLDKVITNKTETTLFADNSTKAVKERVAQIKAQLENEIADPVIEKLRDRVAKLEGKIALFKIGAPTETAKEEIEFRVEDAIQATRAAASDGVVAGGGVALLALSKLSVGEVYRDALRDVFKQLLINANLPAEIKLEEALQAADDFGYNLREGAELVNVVEAGILDPTLVVQQIIANATDVASNILTTDTLLIFENRKDD